MMNANQHLLAGKILIQSREDWPPHKTGTPQSPRQHKELRKKLKRTEKYVHYRCSASINIQCADVKSKHFIAHIPANAIQRNVLIDMYI